MHMICLQAKGSFASLEFGVQKGLSSSSSANGLVQFAPVPASEPATYAAVESIAVTKQSTSAQL